MRLVPGRACAPRSSSIDTCTGELVAYPDAWESPAPTDTTSSSPPTRTTSRSCSWRPRRVSGSPFTVGGPLAKSAFASLPLSTTPASFSSCPSLIDCPRIWISLATT